MKFPPDRLGDNRWNQALDALIAAWNRAGPDAVLDALTGLELAPPDHDKPPGTTIPDDDYWEDDPRDAATGTGSA